MAKSIDVAAEFLDLSGGNLSHLALHKYVYLAHMVYAGQNEGALLVDDAPFEAWDYGPVSPTLYARLRGFGSQPIPRVMLRGARPLADKGTEAVRKVWGELGGATAARLVHITHEECGAWRKIYRAGGIRTRIPQEEIVSEYARRTA